MGVSLVMLRLPCQSENATPCRLLDGIGSGIGLRLTYFALIHVMVRRAQVGRHDVI
jgi:hypothetical protein